jgi:mercuric reductase
MAETGEPTVRGVARATGPAQRNDRARAGEYDYGLIVLGSGSAAFAAAIRARDLGKSVLMVEQGTTGGTCVNVGCIPSKTLLVDSERFRHSQAPPLAKAATRKRALVEELRQAKYVDLLDVYGIEYRNGHGELTDGNTVAIDGESLRADAVLLGVGARPAVPAIPGLAEAGYLTSTTALEMTDAPPRLAVIGANAVGLELGQMLGNFGSRVTFLARRGVAPNAEPEVSAELRSILESDGHEILAPAITTEIATAGAAKVVRGTVDGEPFERTVDEVLVAVGRQPNTDGLGLDRLGLALDSTGAIVVDEHQRTNVPSIYAAGDATTQPRYVYVAAAAGAAVVENALGSGDAKLDFAAMPRIIFTTPAFAQAGLTEADAEASGLSVESRVLPLDAVPRALANGDTRGLFKLVAEAESGRLVGASILADGAPDAIQAAVWAIERGMTVHEIASSWAPYLTMAEGLKLAAQTFERDVSKLSCCAA